MSSAQDVSHPVERSSTWRFQKIRDLCVLVNGRGFKPYEWSDRGLPIIRIQNLNGSPEFNYFSGTFDPKIAVAHGDLLFAWSGSRGTSFGPHIWSGGDAVLNYHTWKVVPRPSVDRRFLFHALRGLTRSIEDSAHGASALVHVQKWEMEGLDLPIPAFCEQKMIAEALDDSDDQIAALGLLISKKRAIKQGMMQELLTGRTRLPGFAGEWSTVHLSDVATVDPEALSPATVSTNEVIDYISLEDVSKGSILGSSRHRFGDAPSRARRGLRLGDVLFGTVRPNLQSHGRYAGGLSRPVASTGFAVIRNKAGQTDSKYVAQWVLSGDVVNQIERIIAGSNYPAVSSGDVRRLELQLPPVDEQEAIGRVLQDADDEIEALERRLEATRAIKQGMMQELLTGRTRLVGEGAS